MAGAAEQHQLSKWEVWSHTGLPKLVNGNWGAPHHARQRVWGNMAYLAGLVLRRRKAKEMQNKDNMAYSKKKYF